MYTYVTFAIIVLMHERPQHALASTSELDLSPAEHEMRASLVDASCELMFMPPNSVMQAEATTEVIIADHRQIEVNNRKIELSTSAVAFCNLLLSDRGASFTTLDLATHIDCTAAYVARRMAELHDALNDGETPPIKVAQPKGEKNGLLYYSLSESVLFYDERQHWQERDFFLRRHVEYENNEPAVQDGRTAFKTKRARVEVGAAMLRDFKDDPQVESSLTDLLHQIAESPAQSGTLSLQTERELFGTIDQALTHFVKQGNALLEHERKEIISGVKAMYKLFFHHKHVLDSFDRKRRSDSSLWSREDQAQEASICLMEAILKMEISDEENRGRFEQLMHVSLGNAMAERWVETVWSLGQKRGIRVYRDVTTLQKSEKRLTAQLGRSVTVRELSNDLNWSSDRVEKLLGYSSMSIVSLQEPLRPDGPTREDSLELEEFRGSIDADIEQIAMEDDVQELLASSDLTDNEKIVMSLRFGVYSSHLCGAEAVTGRADRATRAIFTYPYDKETFLEIIRQRTTVQDLDELFGVIGYCNNRFKTGRPKAKAFLEERGCSVF